MSRNPIIRISETVPGVPGLYVRHGKRKSSYSTRLNGKYTGLGNNEEAAKRTLRGMLGLASDDDAVEDARTKFHTCRKELVPMEYVILEAQTIRRKFLALHAAGFTNEQALELCRTG
jgi:hypothetical protein